VGLLWASSAPSVRHLWVYCGCTAGVRSSARGPPVGLRVVFRGLPWSSFTTLLRLTVTNVVTTKRLRSSVVVATTLLRRYYDAMLSVVDVRSGDVRSGDVRSGDVRSGVVVAMSVVAMSVVAMSVVAMSVVAS